MRLCQATIGNLPLSVVRPGYTRSGQAIGIVHFGLGAFHRAHQAIYTDAAMSAGDTDFGIAGVSLRSVAVRDQLAPQDCLYTVSEQKNDETEVRLIGAVQSILLGGANGSAVTGHLANPQVSLVSFTITEKGYHRTTGGELNLHAPPVASDLSGGTPSTIYGFLRRGLARRMNSGSGGLTLLSCDNLSDNGRVLRSAFLTFLSECDPQLLRWVEAECTFPSSMVDRIVPATTRIQVAQLERQIGLQDEAAVFTEPFSQWVIEDRFAGRRPRWEVAGAEIVADVREYEAAKLRMLNGAHSALAYLGLEGGCRFVNEAIEHPSIRDIILKIMFDEAATTVSSRIDTRAYGERLLARFENKALEHRLQQIAIDGSQKIPQRWLATLAHNQNLGRICPALLEALASWIRFVRGDRFEVDDPMASELARLWRAAGSAGIVAALFGQGGHFAHYWTANDDERTVLNEAVSRTL